MGLLLIWYQNSSFVHHAKAAKIEYHSSLSTWSLKCSYLASLETGADNTAGLTKPQVLLLYLPGIPSLPSIKCYQLLSTYKCSLHSSLKINEPGLSLMGSHSMPWYFHSKLYISWKHKILHFVNYSSNHCEVRRISEGIEILRWGLIQMFESCWMYPNRSHSWPRFVFPVKVMLLIRRITQQQYNGNNLILLYVNLPFIRTW